MIEEFISLLESGKEEAFEVLRPQVDPKVLKYLVGGFFDEKQKRLVAYALMPVNKEYFWKYDYLLDFSHGHSAIFFGRKKEDISVSGVYQDNKSLQEYIEEGFYRHNLVSFLCEYDFDEWNILTSNCFTDSKNRLQIIESELHKLKGNTTEHFFNQSIFTETEKYYDEMNSFLEKSETRKSLNPDRKMPKLEVSTEMKPFIGHSHLVALIRLKKKGEINRAYTAYVQKAIFDPLIVKLKTFYANDYQRIEPFHFYPCNMLFPEHRRYCLFICLTYNQSKKIQLRFFLYTQENDRIYEWIYFPPSTYKNHKVDSFTISEIFKPISKFDNQDYLTHPECTFDDDDFWNNYVFKKENGEYVYLKEIKFNN